MYNWPPYLYYYQLLTLKLPGLYAGMGGSLTVTVPLCSGMGEVVPARTLPTLLPHPLALCCHYLFQRIAVHQLP